MYRFPLLRASRALLRATLILGFAGSLQVHAATRVSISGQPPTSVNEGSAYSFTPTASDANGDALTFSISGKPAWANFSTASGMLSGTPAAADVGTYSGVLISVTDGKSTSSLPSFAIA